MFIGKGGFCEMIEIIWLGDIYVKKSFNMYSENVFIDEVNVLVKLCYCYMVIVLDYFMDLELYLFFMDRMFCDLCKYMELRWKDGYNLLFLIMVVIDLMFQGVEVMIYMYFEGMVNCDLKLENIFVELVDDLEFCWEGFVVVKLVDLGLVKLKCEVIVYFYKIKD